MTRTLPALLAIPSCLFSLTVQADTRLTAGLTSNEIWRGLSQSDNELSPFVGLDVGAETGPYFGAWAGYYRFDEDEVVWGNNDFGQLRLDLKYREFSIGISGAGSGSGNSDTLILAAWTWSVDLQ